MAWLALVGVGLSVAGSMQAAKQAKEQGQLDQNEKYFEAEQYNQKATEAIAASQRDMIAQQDRTKLVASRAVAVAAASGGGAADPTVNKVIADINGRGAFNAATELYKGESEARNLNLHAVTARYEGDVAKEMGGAKSNAYEMQAAGNVVNAGSSLYGKYGAQQQTRTTDVNPNYTPYGQSSAYNNAFDNPDNYG